MKFILSILFKIFHTLKINSRVINFLNNKRYNANDGYNFQNKIEKLLIDKKLIALDIGSQGGFNSDNFFSKDYNKYFKAVLVDPLQSSKRGENNENFINKGLWSSKTKKKLYILGKRPESSSLYEPDSRLLNIHDFKKKNYHLFDVTETKDIECDTISSSLNSFNIKELDYLKIDTQGSEFEIIKGLGDFRPLLIKCEVQIHSMYKNVPSWNQLLNLLYELNYIVIDWKTIGFHSTRSPVEADMIFIPDFKKESGKKLILNKQKEFISLMLISGQIKILQKISENINLEHSEYFMKIKDRYFF